jgi:sialate O-acetylesterase
MKRRLISVVGRGVACTLLIGSWLSAAVKPAAIFTDNAVLQQGMKVKVWGTAKNGEKVTVKFNSQEANATTVGDRWQMELQPMEAGGPFTMTIAGENTVERKNLYIGEVWLCSGQSNMWWPLAETENAPEVISQSKDEKLRLFTVPLTAETAPAKDLPGGHWDVCGPDTVGNFSAVAYYFGRELRQSLKVPVGLVSAAYGGSIVQAWTSQPYIRSDPESSQYLDNLPFWAQGPQNRFCVLYNGMIAPIIPYSIRGVIWYQGEGNTEAAEADHYRTSFPLLIRNWRQDWGQGDFPFLFVQLAPWARDAFFHVSVDPEATGWAVLREAQLLASQTVPNTAMAVIMDAGDENMIHPKRKEPVGYRLALAARAMAYGQDVVYQSPVYKSMEMEGSRAVLYFDHADGGLVIQGDAAAGFQIAGSDQKFYPARAQVVGQDKVEVWSDQVAQPVAVRYGWANYPVVNLFSRAGLPMCPFRTDNWPPEKPFKTYPWPPKEN